MKLPGFLLRHTITWRADAGPSGLGPTESHPVTHRCWLEHGQKTVRDAAGTDRVSTARAFLPLDVTPLPKGDDQVTFDDGTSGTVISVARRDGSGLPVPSHWEVAVG